MADQIRKLIAEGRFPPPTRLPAERELAHQLNISRPSLREALIVLEIEGTIEVRQGSGIYVLNPAVPAQDLERSLGESPTELMQARLAVEGSVILLACGRADPAFLNFLHVNCEEMRSAIAEGIDPMELDRAFHLAIAEQTGNSVLGRIVMSLFDERFSRISARINSRYENRDSWTAAVREHDLITQALQARDSLSAQVAMMRHLQLSTERWTDR